MQATGLDSEHLETSNEIIDVDYEELKTVSEISKTYNEDLDISKNEAGSDINDVGFGDEKPEIDTEKLDKWIGEYTFTEFWEPYAHELPVGLMVYSITVNIKDSAYYAEVYIDGNMTMKRLKARVTGSEEFIELVFENYLPDNMNFVIEPYKEGDLLLRLKRNNIEITTQWGALTPVLPENNQEGVYFLKTDDIGYS